MVKKVILALDSFKGCISSVEIAHIIETHYLGSGIEFTTTPLSDGGEGMIEALAYDGVKRVKVMVHDPLMRPIDAEYLITNDNTAIIEMASAAGLPLIATEERDPITTTTYGVGEIIADALRRGCKQFLMGIGGSATNDAGTGMLQALGFRFLDKTDTELNGTGGNLDKIIQIDSSKINPLLNGATFEVACDVNNPFYGDRGAAYVYAPQKGADAKAVEELDRGLRNFTEVITRSGLQDISLLEGAGAAGGVGGGMVALLGAELKPGIDMVLDYIRFDATIEEASLIITGEGKMDSQTLMGKAPQGVLKRGLNKKIPVIALAGRIDEKDRLAEAGFAALFEISPREMPLTDAMRKNIATQNIKNTLNTFDINTYMI